MPQLSRPYQLGVVAALLAALALVVGLRLHGSGGGSAHSGSAAVKEAPQTNQAGPRAGQGNGAAGPTTNRTSGTTHPNPSGGTSAGASGATHRSASGAARRNASGEESHRKASGGTHHKASGAAPHSSSGAAHHKASGAAHHKSSGATRHGGGSATTRRHAGSPAVAIERELHAGKVVLVLFWNPASSNDIAVHGQVEAVSRALGSKVAVHFAKPAQVGSFGTVTRDIKVYQTPTVLVIGRKGQTRTLTGLEDAFSIEQAVQELKRGERRSK